MSQKREIEGRLHNWSRWCNQTRVRPSDADSITGFICDRMRSARLGNVYSGHTVIDPVDEVDAALVERAMRKLFPYQHQLLKHHFVKRDRWQIGCRIAHIRVCKELYDQTVKQVVAAIEQILMKEA